MPHIANEHLTNEHLVPYYHDGVGLHGRRISGRDPDLDRVLAPEEAYLLAFLRAVGVSNGSVVTVQVLDSGAVIAGRGRDRDLLVRVVHSTPMYSGRGELEAIMVIVRDMSPLEKLERLRSEFLGTVSQELRTPLTSIRCSATTLLMDFTMPGTDEIELMRDITRTVDVSAIFVSSYGREEHVTRPFDMGASGYMVKPFLPSELAARIRAALHKGASGRTGPVEPFVLGDLAVR
ncbi:MAG: response regulator [Chloroflexi bacterium]|nr:response regulator [Chloroflexota bacterium]